MEIWKLQRARQAKYGIRIPDDDPRRLSSNSWETLLESFDEVDLSIEWAEGVEKVEDLPDDATYEDRWNALARLENWPDTYAEQVAVRAAAALADAEDD